MFFTEFFTSFGGALGNALGGGILSTIGRFAGKMFGQYLDKEDYTPSEHYHYKRQMEMLFLDSNVLGKPIALVFGKAKVYGHIIWAKPIHEVENISTTAKYFKNGETKSLDHTISYSYFGSFAIAICEGEIEGFEKVWANEQLLDLANYNYRLYTGSETQDADPLIRSEFGDRACAFRGLAYLVFQDMPLDSFNNKIPLLAFEVTRKIHAPEMKTVEELVKSIILIPGSGEFVYDTKPLYKIYHSHNGTELWRDTLNSHNHKGIANSVHSLNQLMSVCPNLRSVGLVACWFGNSLDLANCDIMPAVEYKCQNTSTSEEWRVADFDRNTARLIGKEGMHPRYGGSVNDASLVRYLQELKSRGLKIMLYPMFFMDIPGKPWRGHLTGNAEDVEHFFTKEHGYNNFILHYANLTKDLVDAFVIGSELKKLTAIRDNNNNFPAVEELVKLAEKIKSVVGSGVKLTYAADWSEYHHTEGGWFHLDQLWANPAIDFIGIDAYVPITLSSSSQISDEEIKSGWSSGEGYDYYINQEGQTIPLSPEYAWKNFAHWWNNTHINPDGRQTPWRPRMKKICFTEFGYPSIDKATNQPNVFFDPNCIDGGAPIYSNSITDFSIQRRAIKASIEYWQNNEMLEDMYLWTWDARPYPAWPYYNIWTDGYLWEKGHWVNNKFGIVSLARIVLYLCQQAGLQANEVDVTNLDIPIEGVVFEKSLPSIDAINLLRCCYFFDIYQDQSKLIFRKRGSKFTTQINKDDLVELTKFKHFELKEISSCQVLNQVNISFINQNKKYHTDYIHTNIDIKTNRPIYHLHLPIILQENDAYRIASMIINNARSETKVLTFMLPITYLHLSPCDVVVITILSWQYHMRIIDIELNGLLLKITALSEDTQVYHRTHEPQARPIEYIANQEQLECLHLPSLPWLSSKQHYLHIAYSNQIPKYLYASLDNQNFDQVAKINHNSIIGTVVSFHNNQHSCPYVIDDVSRFIIYCEKPIPSFCNEQFWQRDSIAYIGKEIIRFKNTRSIGQNMYEISHLIRGELNTATHINNHNNAEPFVLIGKNISHIPIDDDITQRDLFFKLGQKSFKHKIQPKLLPSPINFSYSLHGIKLTIKWTGCDITYDDWITSESNHLWYQIIISKNHESISLNTQDTFMELKIAFAPPFQIGIKSILGTIKSSESVIIVT